MRAWLSKRSLKPLRVSFKNTDWPKLDVTIFKTWKRAQNNVWPDGQRSPHWLPAKGRKDKIVGTLCCYPGHERGATQPYPQGAQAGRPFLYLPARRCRRQQRNMPNDMSVPDVLAHDTLRPDQGLHYAEKAVPLLTDLIRFCFSEPGYCQIQTEVVFQRKESFLLI